MLKKEKVELNNYIYKPIAIILCNPYKKKSEYSIEVKTHYIFVGNVSKEIKKILNNISDTINYDYDNLINNMCITKNDVEVLKKKFGEKWFDVIKLSNFLDDKDIKFIIKNKCKKNNIKKNKQKNDSSDEILELESDVRKEKIESDSSDNENNLDFLSGGSLSSDFSDSSDSNYSNTNKIKYIYEKINQDDSIYMIQNKIFKYINISIDYQHLWIEINNKYKKIAYDIINNITKKNEIINIEQIYENSNLNLFGLENIPINERFANSLSRNMSFIESKQNSLLYKYIFMNEENNIKIDWNSNICNKFIFLENNLIGNVEIKKIIENKDSNLNIYNKFYNGFVLRYWPNIEESELINLFDQKKTDIEFRINKRNKF